ARGRARRLAFEGARPVARRDPPLPGRRRREATRGSHRRGRAPPLEAAAGVGAGGADRRGCMRWRPWYEALMTENGDRVSFHVCPLCEATCGLEIRTRGREVPSIRGDEADVFSHGFICPKAYALKALDADPDRVRGPLVRR